VRVLVAEPLADEGLELLHREHDVDYRPTITREELLRDLPVYEALIVRSGARIDAEAIDAGSRLAVIGRAGVGVDNIDVAAATSAGILVVNAPTANTMAAAELTVGLIYALARNIAAADASIRRGEWRRADFMGTELAGKTLGIVGLGKIGFAVADRAVAMEMTIVASDPFVSEEVAAARGVRLVELDELLRVADVVTLHVPLAAATRGLINEERLSLMKPTAVVVNVARGGVVDEAALAAALHSGRLAGAAIDVYEQEPVRDSPLLKEPNTVLTPHLGASTREAQARAGIEVAEQVVDALAGRAARYAVNTPATKAAAARDA
jgi:D-3-phosphoglycerate dehydrogenase